MKLLIIEDAARNQAAARVQFPEAIVANYDEAYKILRDARPGDFSSILTDMYFKIEENRVIPSAPFSPTYRKNMAAIGAEMPFGLAFVLKGIELNTPVALVSEEDHHSDLFTGLLDMLGMRGFYPRKHGKQGDRVPNPKFLLLRDGCPRAEDMYWDGTTIIREQRPSWEKWHKDKEGNPELSLVKDWRDAIQQLTELLKV